MKLKYTAFALIICIFLTCLVSCKTQEEQYKLQNGYTDSLNATGGDDVNDPLLYNVKVEGNTDKTTITLSFTCGTGSSGSDTSDNAVPEYSAVMTGYPRRVLFKFDSISTTSMLNNGLSNNSGLVFGAFMCSNATQTIYGIQFNGNVCVSLTESDFELVLTVMPHPIQPADDKYFYHITANALNEYNAGTLNGDTLQPCLASDGKEIMFISPEYDSEKDAKSAYKSLTDTYPALKAKSELTAIYAGKAPIYNPDLNYAELGDTEVIKDKSESVTVEPLVPGGIFLCMDKDGSVIFETRVQNADSTSGYYSEIHILSNESDSRLISRRFEGIESASLSSDGKYLAVHENAANGSHLYIYDTAGYNELYDLSLFGFGKRISTFTWNDDGTAIYAISGTSNIAINMYDFNVADEGIRVSCVYSGAVDESSLVMNDGLLYFVSTDENGSSIYSIRPESGAVRLYAKGSSISFSPDGKYSAITTASTVATDNNDSELIISNTESGESKTVENTFPVYNFKWAMSSDKLYYIHDTTSADSDTTESGSNSTVSDTPYELFCYDINSGTSTRLGNLESSSLYSVPGGGVGVITALSDGFSVATYSIK